VHILHGFGGARRCPAGAIALIPRNRSRNPETRKMADHGEVEYATADGNDYVEHEATYRLFLGIAKWGTIAVVVILILMAYFLV
jgi:aa3 type cytochrome c oxidase subunit IV